MKKIKITHTERPIGFGKVQKHIYEGVIFEKGKVAYVDKDNQLLMHNSKDDLEKALNKNGEVIIDEQ